MRVFGYIQLLLDEKILELETVERLYSFRVLNIVRNPHIREAKLVKKGQFWSDFCRLWKSLEGRGTWTENVAYLKRETEEDEVLDPEVRQRRLEDLAVTAACHVGRRA